MNCKLPHLIKVWKNRLKIFYHPSWCPCKDLYMSQKMFTYLIFWCWKMCITDLHIETFSVTDTNFGMGTNLGDKIFSICSSGLFIRCGSLQFILEFESTFSVTHTRDFTLKYYCHEVCEGDF